MSARLVIVGCGGFGREVFSLVHAINDRRGATWEVVGFVDDAPSPENLTLLDALGVTCVGSTADLADGQRTNVVLAVGDNEQRADLAARLTSENLSFPVLVHPDATIGLDNRLGHGVVVAAGARLSTNVRIGPHAHIDQNATLGHDVELRQFARVSPQGCISGSVRVGEGALVGAGATVLPGISVGKNATVGAGAVAVRDVPAATTVKGVPAR